MIIGRKHNCVLCASISGFLHTKTDLHGIKSVLKHPLIIIVYMDLGNFVRWLLPASVYNIYRLMHAPFPYQECYHPERPISARGMITVLIWKKACIVLFIKRFDIMLSECCPDIYRCGTSGVYVWAKSTLLPINMW
jgi:hypothetical protein